MSTALVLREQPAENWPVYVAGIAELRRMVLLLHHVGVECAELVNKAYSRIELRQAGDSLFDATCR
jgi:hypothetical protein